MKLAIHFTNGYHTYGKNKGLHHCSHIDNISSKGFRKYSNFVLANNEQEIKESINYIHHGMRTNGARGYGYFSIPAVVWVNLDNVRTQQGYDGKTHIQINESIVGNGVLKVTYIDTNGYVTTYATTTNIYNPKDIIKIGKKGYIPFYHEFMQHEEEIFETLNNIRITIQKELVYEKAID